MMKHKLQVASYKGGQNTVSYAALVRRRAGLYKASGTSNTQTVENPRIIERLFDVTTSIKRDDALCDVDNGRCLHYMRT